MTNRMELDHDLQMSNSWIKVKVNCQNNNFVNHFTMFFFAHTCFYMEYWDVELNTVINVLFLFKKMWGRRPPLRDNLHVCHSFNKDPILIHHGLAKCILCQDDRCGEALRRPANNFKCDNIEKDYVVFADNLKNYVALAPLPFHNLNLDALDEGDGVSLTSLRHSAKWHPSCKAMIKKSKIKRLHQATKKRHASAPTHCAPYPKYTRSKCEPFSTKHCFLIAQLKVNDCSS